MLTLAASAFAVHTSTADLAPEWSAAGQTMDYTVRITNNGPDAVDEVRIYKNEKYENFVCNTMEGWFLSYPDQYQHICNYRATSGGISKDSFKHFTFSAQTPESGCELTWEFETRDVTDTWYPVTDTTSVDDLAPSLIKLVSGPQSGTCPPGSGDECWITQSTTIGIDVTEQGDCGISGLDYCEVTYTVDGGNPIVEIYAELDGGTEWNHSMTFDEDSRHVLTVECKDIAGNMLTDTEVFRVDDTPPVTTKEFFGPQKIIDGTSGKIEWIDGITTIRLTTQDGGPICAIGGEKTFYKIIPADDSVCETSCMDGGTSTPTVDGTGWTQYIGPIGNIPESCHLMEYYSVDNIENIENVKTNCFFVDKKPPTVSKDNGSAIPDSGEPDFVTNDNPNGAFHWITTKMPINFDCVDQEPHPSGDEELCFKVSYDYPSWGYITDKYCSAGTMNQEDYCCVDVSGAKEYDFYFKEESMHNLEYYCEDAVEKKSDVHTQYYKVDDTKPVIDKFVGQPQVGTCPPPQGFDQTGGDCYIRDHVTPVTFEAYDGAGLGCAVDDITCEWKYRVNGGTWNQTYTFDYKEGPWNTYGDTPAVITKEYLSDSIKWTIHIEGEAAHYGVGLVLANLNDPNHPFQVWANNGNAKWQTQVLHLDETPCWNQAVVDCPSGVCSNGITATPGAYNLTNQDFTITVPKSLLGEAGSSFRWAMHVERLDQGYYPATWANDWCGPISKYEEEMVSPGIIFPEDSIHYLEIKCWDALGNEIIDQETFQVDSIPPVTTKAYGVPFYTDNSNDWITTKTPITLTATDNKVGVDKIYYRTCLYNPPNGVVANGSPSSCTCEGSTDFAEYGTPFTIAGESEHCIEFYSTDLLGNTEIWNSQLVYVEDTPPEVTKTVGEPQEVCEEGNPTGCDYYITKDTPITFNCVDPSPHPVDNVVIKYRYSLGDDCISFSEPTEWQIVEGEIRFPTDSCHKLEYYCEDALGNSLGSSIDPLIEIDIVDTVGPEITVDVSDPKITQECPPEMGGECLYIDGKTVLTVNAVDPQPHPVDAVTCEWDYTVSGGEKEGSGGIETELPFNINFPEESVHSLNIVCKDALGNDTEFNGTYIVDHTPPETYKRYAGPQYSGGLSEYPFFQTTTGDQAVDIKVEDLGDSIKWTVDFPIDDDTCNGLMAVGLIIATNGVGNGPAFQIHNNDGTDSSHNWGTWLMSPYDNGWHSSSINTPVTTLDWVSATGGRYKDGKSDCPEPNPNGIFTITIDKSELGEDFHWALYTAIGQFCEHAYQQATYPNEFGWGEPIVTSTNYEYAESVKGEYPKWITSDTEVWLSATDPEPHPSGVAATFYRDIYLEEEEYWHYCFEDCDLWVADPAPPEPMNPDRTKGWTNWTGNPFYKAPESCHIIEYYSVDNVGKVEDIKWQCVFVDDTPPEPAKVVGEPNDEWHPTEIEITTESYKYLADACWSEDPKESVDCWEVTLLTPIDLACEDQDPHPVGNETVCFKVEVDGDDATGEYCETYDGSIDEDGFCCMEQGFEEFYFTEETEHNLQYYCVDALENTGPIDDEKFKVRGTAFEIELNKKWNLISVPFVLLNDNIETVLESVEGNVDSVWTYDPNDGCDIISTPEIEHWCVYRPNPDLGNLKTMEPGVGYWLAALEDDVLTIGGSLFSPAVTPPDRPLEKGWNLIGYYGTDGMLGYDGPSMTQGARAGCKLYSLGPSTDDKGWSTLLSYWEPYNSTSGVWNTHGLAPGLSYDDRMDPGAGYWISVLDDGYTYTYRKCESGGITV